MFAMLVELFNSLLGLVEAVELLCFVTVGILYLDPELLKIAQIYCDRPLASLVAGVVGQ